MAIIRDANGLFAICGICRNSLRSIDPDPSLWRACVHAKEAGEGEETHHRACEPFLGQRANGQAAKHLSSFMKRFFSRSSSLALTVYNTHSTHAAHDADGQVRGACEMLIGRTVGPPLHVFHKL